MKYSQLYEGSICTHCVGCEKLSNDKFKGLKVSAKPVDEQCNNFFECYTTEDKARKLREENDKNSYGSMYGTNY